MNEETMSNEERGALQLAHLAINELIFTHPKLLCERLPLWQPPEPGLLTPNVLRSTLRECFRDLPRAAQLEEHVVARIKMQGVPFLRWEAHPESVKGSEGFTPDRWD